MSENFSLSYSVSNLCVLGLLVSAHVFWIILIYVADDSLGFYMIELLLQPPYTTSSSALLREFSHFTVSKVKFRMSMTLFGRHPFIHVLTMQILAWIVGGF